MTTVAIMQPTYLPWLGYFDMLDQADVFVLLDTVDAAPKSWQTRNRIRARDGQVLWLSVPTQTHRGTAIVDTPVVADGWQDKHRRTLLAAYGHAPHFDTLAPVMRLLTPPLRWDLLAGLNATLITAIAAQLGIQTLVVRASMFDDVSGDPYRRVEDLCRALQATELLNTPGAKEWLGGHDVGVPVRWHQYEHPTYRQGDAPFCSFLSVVDVLAWCGPDALGVIRSGRV